MIFIDSANFFFSFFFFFLFREVRGISDNRLGRLVFILHDIRIDRLSEGIDKIMTHSDSRISLITSLFFSGVWNICINVQFLWRQVAMATTFIRRPVALHVSTTRGISVPCRFRLFSVPRHIHVTGILRGDIVMRTTKQTLVVILIVRQPRLTLFRL